jgi:hypothetical protein
MTTDNRNSLREIALRLRGYRKFQNSQSRGQRELLQLLQGQEIGACFDFPSDAGPRIDIPAKFWTDTRSGDFQKQLTSRSTRAKHGQFLVKSAKFIDQYIAWFNENYLRDGVSVEKKANVAMELTSAFANMNRRKEAYVLESEWARFVEDTKLDVEQVAGVSAKTTRGRHALTSWDVVMVEVAVELLTRLERGGRLDEPSKIADIVLEQSKSKLAKNNPAPGHSAVTRKISEILQRVYVPTPDRG